MRQQNISLLIMASLLLVAGCDSKKSDSGQTKDPISISPDTYKSAEKFLSWNSKKYVRNGAIQHHWIGESDQFWYEKEIEGGKEYILVDATTGHKGLAFDHAQIANALSKATSKEVAANSLNVKSYNLDGDTKKIGLFSEGKMWLCHSSSETCSEKSEPNIKLGDLISPDGKWALSRKDHNLFIRKIADDTLHQLTTDGVEHYSYGGLAGTITSSVTLKRMQVPLPPIALWSSDSKKVISHRLDEREVKDLHLLQYAPEDGNARAKLHTYKYSMPGDENIAKSEMFIFDVDSRSKTEVKHPPLDITYVSPLAFGRVWWSEDNKSIYVLPTEKYAKNQNLLVVDSQTGVITTLIKETSETYIDMGAVLGSTSVRTLSNGSVIWYSERDGWGHLYHYDSDGTLLNQVTKGDFQVREIIRVDEESNQIFFTAGGREEGRDPYLNHLYKVKLDGTSFEILTPENADHKITTPMVGFFASITPGAPTIAEASFSPSGKYFVESFSRVDLKPQTVLRAVEGKIIIPLEEADTSKLMTGGFSLPEPFKVMAADGKTEIFGNIYRPSNFNPKQMYPIIDSIYPGPQTNGVGKSFMTLFSGDRQSLAELGFIVVTIDGRGTPFRSKEFHDLAYGKLGVAGFLEDHISGIKELAVKYPYMDISRVGIYGHSGGGFASTRAILAYPDFFKVAVSSAGNHDQRGYLTVWGATYQGPYSEENYENAINARLASNLKGKLFLSHGDMDDNVHPAMTMQVVDALIKANKDFDFLLIPNASHSYNGAETYFPRRRWNYFVKHLKGAIPPPNYQITGPSQ